MFARDPANEAEISFALPGLARCVNATHGLRPFDKLRASCGLHSFALCGWISLRPLFQLNPARTPAKSASLTKSGDSAAGLCELGGQKPLIAKFAKNCRGERKDKQVRSYAQTNGPRLVWLLLGRGWGGFLHVFLHAGFVVRLHLLQFGLLVRGQQLVHLVVNAGVSDRQFSLDLRFLRG